MKRVTLVTLIPMMFLLATKVGWTQPKNPRIESVDRVSPWVGQLVVLSGTSFGSAPGPAGPRWMSLAPVIRDAPGDSFGPAIPACPVPIVDWSESQILVLITGCSPGEYHVAIRDSSTEDFVRARESNEVAISVSVPPPPARSAVPSDVIRARINLVHPELASPGQLVDLYGDFPNPEPGYDEIILVPSDAVKQRNDRIRQQVLSPLPRELSRTHMRVRLPQDGVIAGEYLLVPAKRGTSISPEGERIVIRSTTPAAWESKSRFRGLPAVPFRLVTSVRIGERLDVLGLNFGEQSPPGQGVHLMTALDLDNVESNFRSREDQMRVRAGIPPALPVHSWSDTRIRVASGGGATFPAGSFFVIINDGASEGWSNAVGVTFP